MSQFVSKSFPGTFGTKQFGLLLHLAAMRRRIQGGAVVDILNLTEEGRILGEPFLVDLHRIQHPVFVERDDKLRLQQFWRVVIRPCLKKKD